MAATQESRNRDRANTIGLALVFLCAVIALVALAVLAARAVLRLDFRWDSPAYHWPFAAAYGGLSVPYEMNERVRQLFEGFPPLPEMVQGLLWRLSGSLNATGIPNYAAFVLFLAYCHRILRAPFWIVALISLTAPLVLIHTTVSYVDLFGNSLLALGISSTLYLHVFPTRASRSVLLGALIGLVGAAWSKYQLAPVTGLGFLLLIVVSIRCAPALRFTSRQVIAIVVLAGVVAAAPYLKNLVIFGNPFWPIRVPIPVLADVMPYAWDVRSDLAQQRPPPFSDRSQVELFFRSLLETENPVSYPNRARWIIDQGNTYAAFRMGGFWFVSVIVYLAVATVMLIGYGRRRGLVASLAIAAVLLFVSALPQSHELRYYLFIPLTLAATIGMLFSHIRELWPRAATGLLVVVLILFSHMASENRTHYEIVTIDYAVVAREWGADRWWPMLQIGQRHCAVDMVPIGILLTGPTMSEYGIVDRPSIESCPAGTIVVTRDGVLGR